MNVTRTYAPALCLILLCSPALAQPDRAGVRALDSKMRRAIQQGDWEQAIETGEKLAELAPAEPGPAYNLACAYAQLGELDDATRWLRIAGERGFSFLATCLRDADLDPIRDHSGFKEALALIRKNSATELEKFKAKHGNAPVLTYVPPGLDASKPAPLIVALHGFGGNANDMLAVWQVPAQKIGAILIAPQAVRKQAIGFDWAVVAQAEWLVLNAIERTKKEHKIDVSRIVLTGFSQGGAMTFTVGLRHPEMFVGLIPVAGFYDHRVDPIPDKKTKLPRFFIMDGARDEEVDNNRWAAQRLEAIGVEHRIKIYDGVGHGFPPNRNAELIETLKFVLAK